MVRAELGNKHTCLNCGAKFYDLNKFEIFCPVCGTQVTLASGEQHIQPQSKQTSPAEDVVQDGVETELKKETLDKSIDSGVIGDDNPIIIADVDLTNIQGYYSDYSILGGDGLSSEFYAGNANMGRQIGAQIVYNF